MGAVVPDPKPAPAQGCSAIPHRASTSRLSQQAPWKAGTVATAAQQGSGQAWVGAGSWGSTCGGNLGDCFHLWPDPHHPAMENVCQRKLLPWGGRGRCAWVTAGGGATGGQDVLGLGAKAGVPEQASGFCRLALPDSRTLAFFITPSEPTGKLSLPERWAACPKKAVPTLRSIPPGQPSWAWPSVLGSSLNRHVQGTCCELGHQAPLPPAEEYS